MFDLFVEFYVRIFTTLLPALAVGVLGLSAARAGLGLKKKPWRSGRPH